MNGSLELLTTSWLLPIARPPLARGAVAVEAGRVTWIGSLDDPARPRGPVRDLGPGVLLPGLVNAHCHLELSHLAGRLPTGDGFVPWVEALVAERGRTPSADVAAAAAEAVSFLEAAGTVAIGDVSNTLVALDALASSSLSGRVFLELLAWDPSRADATLDRAEASLAAATVRLRPGLDLRLAAHAPHSVSPALLRRLVGRGGFFAIHLAESREEVAFLLDGSGGWRAFLEARGQGEVAYEPPGVSPACHLDQQGALHERLVAAHGVQLDAEDRRLLARRGVHVVLCPRSNRNLGVGVADAPALLAAGVRLALGSDSLASVDSLDVLEDAVLLHRQFPGLDPASIVRMATAGGALALGCSGLGTLAPGQRAALAFAASLTPPPDPYAHLLSGQTRLRRVAA